MRKVFIYSEDLSKKSPSRRPERRNVSMAPREQRTRQSVNNNVALTTSKVLGEEKHKYFVGFGNNPALIRRIMAHRSQWVEHDDPKYMFINFRWQQTNKGYRYENCVDSKVFKQTLNHFQFHHELSNKESLLENLTQYCQHCKKNVFDIVPLTFILNLSQSSFDTHLNAFLKFFDNNLPPHMKSDNRKVWMSLKRRLSQHHGIDKKGVYFFCKPQCSQVFYSFNTNYLWLLKPTFLNRGRGIHIFNSLDSLEQLMNSYIQGRQEQSPQKTNQQRKRGPVIKSSSFVVQKYLERPLLINGRKFDIRVWVMISHEMKLYFFKQGYLRTSSETYQTTKDSIDNLYVHLTNNAVQKNNKSYSKHEAGNQLSFKYLEDIMTKYGYNFTDMIKSMKQIVVMTAQCAKKKINRLERLNCFEVFGYDFMLDENAKLWLIQVNTNPCIEQSSPLLAMLLPRMLDDAFKLTLDKMFPSSRQEKQSRFPVSYHSSDENMWELLSQLKK